MVVSRQDTKPGGGGYSQENWAEVCVPFPENPYPISQQNQRFSLPISAVTRLASQFEKSFVDGRIA